MAATGMMFLPPTIVELAAAGAPEDWAEAIVTIIVGVLSWWLGRERERKRRK